MISPIFTTICTIIYIMYDHYQTFLKFKKPRGSVIALLSTPARVHFISIYFPFHKEYRTSLS